MNSYNPEDNQGALERLGIPVQTTPPEQVLTSGKAKSIRFRISRPQGYAFGDVESYLFDYVIPTLDWYASTLHQRDLAIHALGELIDKTEVDLMNVKAQLDNKDYNEAIGIAVEDNERDAEMEILLEKVESLQAQLAHAHSALAQAQQAPISSPDGEEVYTRAEVEGFLASAVEDANTAKDAEYASIIVTKDEEYNTLVQQYQIATSENVPSGYSEEELRNAIQQAVAEAVAETERAKDMQYQSVLQGHEDALREAEQRAAESEQRAIELEQRAMESEQQAANFQEKAEQAVRAAEAASSQSVGYTQDELEQAIENAVAAKEAEMLAQMPEDKPLDRIAELTDEGDLKYKAELKTLKASFAELNIYCKELEQHIQTLEGTTVSPEPVPEPTTGRPLPKLRPEDL